MADTTDRVRMPLLERVTLDALDEEYEHVAARRSDAARPPPPSRGHRTAAVVAAVFGVLVVTAAVQTERDAETTRAGREELVNQVQERSEELRDMQARIRELRDTNAARANQLQLLVEADRAVSAEVRQLGVVTGFLPVTGPGVRILVGDSPDGSAEGMVRDQDLATLLDGLWAAGAEAIAVNGQRVTALGGLQNVGRAVHLGTVPLTPPYTVLAVGNPNTLQARFADSSQGGAWFALRNAFGFEFEMSNAAGLSLPAEPMPRLRSAEEVSDPDQSRMEGNS